MNIERLSIEKIDKNGSIEPNCFIGVNGSGKSQVLETLAELFYYLDKLYGNPSNKTIISNTPLLFELDYSVTIKNKEYLIQIKQHQPKGKAPEILITQNGKQVDWNVDSMHNYLPKKIIAYTSGANETLSFPFLDYYDEYAEYTAKRAFGTEKGEDYEPRFYLMDYTTNIGVVIANLVYFESKKLQDILEKDKCSTIKRHSSYQRIR
jgi:predicted ATP-binding protein involved in virulence